MVLWNSSFEGDWLKEWATTVSWGSQNMKVLTEGNRTFLRAAYPKGSINPGNPNAPTGGCSFKSKFALGATFLWLRYDIRFPVGFSFVRGGKLPGLYGGTAPSGGKIPNGTDGWSARLMWRPGGAGEVYAYLPTSEKWGTRLLTGNWTFPADGQHHTVEMCLKLNTPGQSDGFVKMYFDGKFVGYAGDLRFRDVDTLKIDGVWVETFFGGGDPTWASPADQYADFSRFAVDYNRITEYPVPPPPPTPEQIIETLKSQITTLETSIRGLKTELEVAEAALGVLREDLGDAQNTISALEDEVGNLEVERDELQSKYDLVFQLGEQLKDDLALYKWRNEVAGDVLAGGADESMGTEDDAA